PTSILALLADEERDPLGDAGLDLLDERLRLGVGRAGEDEDEEQRYDARHECGLRQFFPWCIVTWNGGGCKPQDKRSVSWGFCTTHPPGNAALILGLECLIIPATLRAIARGAPWTG